MGLVAVAARRQFGGFIGTPPLVREHLFSTHTPDDIVESCAASVQSEAVRASLIDPLIRRARSKRVTTPCWS